jgi:hypothetical protein
VEGAAHNVVGCDLSLVGVDLVPVVLTETVVEVNLVEGKESRALPEPATNPEDGNHGNGKNVLQDTLGRVRGTANGDSSIIELSSQNDAAENKTQPRAIDTTSSLEGNQIEGTALAFPGSAEANVALTDC